MEKDDPYSLPPKQQPITGPNTPEQCLVRGAEILGRKLYPLGFSFEEIELGRGSGGDFATGCFKNGDRMLTLWFRHELGGVSYKKHDVERSHVEYMQALGREDTANYPGFGHGDKMAAFHQLLQDLEYCDSFLTDEGNAFYKLMKEYKYKEPAKGFAALSHIDKT